MKSARSSRGQKGVRSRASSTTIATSGEDRISHLPDCILGEIMSRLPTTDEAIRLQVLSSRWRHLWRSFPLNADLKECRYYFYAAAMSRMLAAHPGPCRRLKLRHILDIRDKEYELWLRQPSLNGLQVLEMQPHNCPRNQQYVRKPLPLPLLGFASTLHVLKIASSSFPSATAIASLRFPQLELFSIRCSEISQGALHAVLSGCSALKTFVLDECTGFMQIRINSSTIITFAVSIAPDFHERQMKQVVIESAPLLEKLVPFQHNGTNESFELKLISAPKLRILGSLSKTISILELGETVFNQVVPDDTALISRKRISFPMRTIELATVLHCVKVLALEDTDSIDAVTNFLMCFPCLEKLYVWAQCGFRSGVKYDQLYPIECFQQHLKKVVLKGYACEASDVAFAKFFVSNAQVLELLTLVSFPHHQYRFRYCKEWFTDQQRKICENRVSQHAKLHFACDKYYHSIYHGDHQITDFAEHVHDSSVDDPFDIWFQPERGYQMR